ncbi:MAG: T9SS type A sorting domain-containing protein, partial [Saprospiraceae bacterium]|nr:T9SS type A sorting domain-containing protein [Saprospiraceae bacterium]
LAGSKSNILNLVNDAILIKTDDRGNTITNFIRGRVFHDTDGQCNYDGGDRLLNDWLIIATGEKETFFGSTDEEGRFNITVDTGKYVVDVLPANAYWSSCLEGGYELELTEFYDTTELDFPVLEAVSCPYLEVDVSTPFLAVCSDVRYDVSYCNTGTATAEGAFVEVELDEELTFVSSGIAFSEREGNRFTFPLGDIAPSECGTFEVNTRLACEGIASGQAGMVSAHIFPDEFCIEPDPNWDGSSVVVSGICQDNEILFRLSNVGTGDMEVPQRFFVVEDDVMFKQEPYQLDADQDTLIELEGTGATYRMIAEQSPFHPGMNFPTAVVEGCVEEGVSYTTGKVTQFPENDQDPFLSVDVQEIIGSGADISLRGYPKGYRDSIIDSRTDLTYTIFFRNTGTDTIDRIVIRDTLSSNLDITTVVPGASNFSYDFEIYDQGVLKFTFTDIELLPDGSAEEASTRGYVSFTVSQKPSNPVGAIIENSAAVFLGFQAPVQTNVVRNVVDVFPNFVELLTSTDEVFIPGVKAVVFPNPFVETATLRLEGASFDALIFSLYDIRGKLLRQRTFNGNQIAIHRDQLPAGTYFYKVETNGQLVNTGKLLVR